MRVPLTLVVLGIATWAYTAMAQQPAVRVELIANAQVHAAVYHLGDVAHVSAGDQGIETRLRKLVVGASPRPGYRKSVSRIWIQGVLARGLPALSRKVAWSGAERVELIGRSQSLALQPLAQKGIDFLRTNLARGYPEIDRWDIRPVGDDSSLSLPYGRIETHMRTGGGSNLRPRMCIWVEVKVDGKPVQSVPIWYAVKAWRDVYVAQSALHQRQSLAGGVLAVDERNVAPLDSTPLPMATDLSKLRSKVAIPPGTVITRNRIQAVPAVSADARVKVIAESGPVLVETDGIAKADGVLGETVPVNANHGTGVFLATVVAPGIVQVK